MPRRARAILSMSNQTVYNHVVSEIPPEAVWSPADNPYAIAVSQATWWRCAVQLSVGRLDDPPDPRATPVTSKQIDARNLVFALIQLLAAEALEQEALRVLGIDAIVGHALSQARDRYLEALPGIQQMRNALTHFEDWSLGRGHGPQKDSVAAGSDLRDVAAHFWGFGYHADERVIRQGPYALEVDKAAPAALDLYWAISAAAEMVDRQAPIPPGH